MCGNSTTDERELPLPSTGRGIEGEGWLRPRASDCNRSKRRERTALVSFVRFCSVFFIPPLTPALSPLRGEGEATARTTRCADTFAVAKLFGQSARAA